MSTNTLTVPTPEQLADNLKNHSLWLRSKGAYGRQLRLVGYNLRGCNLNARYLPNCQMIRCDLRGANLSFATLRDSDLIRCDLRSANLSFTTLRDSDLIRCDLRGADTCRADLSGCYLEGTILSTKSDTKVSTTAQMIEDAYDGEVITLLGSKEVERVVSLLVVISGWHILDFNWSYTKTQDGRTCTTMRKKVY